MSAYSEQRWLDSLKALVAINSVSAPGTKYDHSNGEVTRLLSGWLEDLGFVCHIQALNGDAQPGKFNLYARIGPETDGGLVLCGHSDTVPASPDGWAGDPWQLRCGDDRVTGLGCADMKGFFASVIGVLERTDLSTLKRPLAVVATADEESSMSGAMALDGGFLAGFASAVIGEPTGLCPVRAHKGILMERIRLCGRAAHSSIPHHGRNAIAGMATVVAAFADWQEQLRRQYSGKKEYADFDVAWPTTNLGHIQGGDIANRVAPQCLLDIDFRLLPDATCVQIRAEIHRRVMAAVDGLDLGVEFESLFDGVEALSTPAESTLIRCLESHCGQRARGVSFATEAPFFSRYVDEVAVLGPGLIEAAHKGGEWLELEAARRFDGIIDAVIGDLCF